jgi:osmotically inducible lipoprotein OsmB
MTRAHALLLVVGLWAAAGCADMTPTPQRALSGGAIDPAGGAAVGAIEGGALRLEPWLAGRQGPPPEPSGRTPPPRDPVVSHDDPLKL